MQELVTRAQADVFFAAIAALGALVAPVAGLTARRRQGDPLLAAMLWGGPLLLIGGMWWVYNAITDRVGLETVTNLVWNVALFVAVGVISGAAYTLISLRRYSRSGEREPDPPAAMPPAGETEAVSTAVEETPEAS